MFHLLSGVFWEAQKSADMQRKKKKKGGGTTWSQVLSIDRYLLSTVVVVLIINSLYRAFSAGTQRRFILEVIQILKSKNYI